MTKYPYSVELEEDGIYFVQFKDFPTGFTEGETIEEAGRNAQDVLDLLIASFTDDGTPLPVPSELGDLLFAVSEGCSPV